ncbi:MAG: hypothetical protein ABW199_12275 [Caulobacterales bacterium]
MAFRGRNETHGIQLNAPLPNLHGDFRFDGRAALAHILAHAPHGTLLQAVATLTAFSHPETVRQTGGGALFPAIRDASRRRTIDKIARVGFDDNAVPHAIFWTANAVTHPRRDIQLNHVYPRSGDPACYSALANLCVTPSFLAKLTDHDPSVAAALQFRVFELYEWKPAGDPIPQKPDGYDALVWSPPLDPVLDVEARLRARVRSDGILRRIAGDLGWRFSGDVPDPEFAPDQPPNAPLPPS